MNGVEVERLPEGVVPKTLRMWMSGLGAKKTE